MTEPFVETKASPKTHIIEIFPCDTCPRHYPDECPKLVTSPFNGTKRPGCHKFFDYISTLVEAYLPAFYSTATRRCNFLE